MNRYSNVWMRRGRASSRDFKCTLLWRDLLAYSMPKSTRSRLVINDRQSGDGRDREKRYWIATMAASAKRARQMERALLRRARGRITRVSACLARAGR